ncbi:MAG: hypothetical protein K9H64_04635 [Bacteroidales bacterium]|nr:hypothetical protein [Bacteroidales bacterium]MCF8455109.1 hypothetical protein [Bacteroidales bacterium]
MKKAAKFIILAAFLFASASVFAQGPPPPNGNGSDPISGGNSSMEAPPPGGGAPISGGLGMLILMGIGYGGRKYYQFRNQGQNQ